jgi:protein-disulfide isomerase
MRSAESDPRTRPLWQLGGVALAAIAIVIAAVALLGKGSSGTPTATPQPKAGETAAGQRVVTRQLAGIPQRGIALGDRGAPVTVVEFGDLQCPVCAQFNATATPTLVERYIRPGKVRMEFRTLAFLGPDSVRLGRMAAAAARQNRLYQFSELVYANQGAENSGYATDAFLRRMGQGAGLDVPAALAHRSRPAAARPIADASRLARITGVTGTPTFLVGRTGATLKRVDAGHLGAELHRLTS